MVKNDIALRKAKLSARRANIPTAQRALFEKRLQGQSTGKAEAIPRRLERGPAPLSFDQQRLWFQDQWEPGNSAYNVSAPIRLGGQLDVAVLKHGLNEVIRRHEALRTTFARADERPVQIIAPALTVTLPVVDLRELSEAEREIEAQRLTTEEVQQPFDLATGPLVRCTLLRLDEQDHVLLLTMHHIVSDAWSMGIFVREMTALCQAYATGNPSPLLELPIQYADFAVWQRQWLQGEVLEAQLAYWQKQLAGTPLLLALPTDRPRPPVQTFQGNTERFQLDRDLSQRIKGLCQRLGATPFMIFEAAFATLLSRYSGQEDIVIGTPIANRNHREIEPLIGFFVNTLVLRNDLSGNPTFQELLARVQQVALEAYEYQDLPFEMLVEELQPERDPSHNPLFHVTFAFESVPMEPSEVPGLSPSSWEVNDGRAMFDLSLSVTDKDSKFAGTLNYNTDLFDASTITRMAWHFQTLLEGAVVDPEQRISNLPLLTEAERWQLLVEWNDTRTGPSEDSCVHELFEAQVERTPDVVAVVFKDQYLTYGELDRRANQLAHHLRKLDVGPEVLVGICLECSLEMVVGILGVLKAGGGYVLLDPEYPKERLAWVIKDAQVSVLLTQQQLVESLAGQGARVLCQDRDREVIARESTKNFPNGVVVSNLAHVIYTWEFPDKPGGVLAEHRGLCHLAETRIQAFNLQPGSRVLQFACFGAEIWVSGVFTCLLAGATLCLESRDAFLSGPALVRLLRDQAITTVMLPSSLLASLPAEELSELRTIITVGGICPTNILARWATGRQFYNAFGSAEATISATADACVGSSQRPAVGRPIVNVQIYLLDSHLQPVPVGVPGELYIGGDGLARGYLNAPELTAERFIPNPFSERLGACLFKSGDLARYRPDRTIEFLGRAGPQVKIRGRHIELGQIETVIGQHPAVQETVVIAREDISDDKRLVAYVVLNQREASTIGALHSFLRGKLPNYTVPSAFVLLDALPLAPSGRVDRRALPLPGETGATLDILAQKPEKSDTKAEISLRRDKISSRQATLSAVKQALLVKRLRGKNVKRE